MLAFILGTNLIYLIYIPSLRTIFVVVVVIVVVVVVVIIIIISYTLGTHKALNFGYYRHKFACALHAN